MYNDEQVVDISTYIDFKKLFDKFTHFRLVKNYIRSVLKVDINSTNNSKEALYSGIQIMKYLHGDKCKYRVFFFNH